MNVMPPEIAAWDGFYVIAGSAAGALIGLQFVVMTLIAERPPIDAAEAGAAFASPTIMHFGAVLLLSALLHVPWPAIGIAAAFWGVMGFGGLVYTALVARLIRRQTAYRPGLEDWFFHVVSPLAGYLILALSWFAALSDPRDAMFGVGAAALVLLFTGIHNAWDSAAYHVLVGRGKPNGARRTDKRRV